MIAVRFDDSLKTVLSADMSSGIGARSAWRQLVDLVSRDRIPADAATIDRLRILRDAVPLDVRAASGRALAFAAPGAALVALFAEDEIAVAAPVLRTATLGTSEWTAILPRLTPQGRSILRHRRDLPADVVRALDTFGPTDFVLADDNTSRVSAPAPQVPEPIAPPPADTPRSATPFVSLGDVARGLPMVAEAIRRADADAPASGPFDIADIVARIDDFRRTRDAKGSPPSISAVAVPRDAFQYETDRAGTLTWIEGIARGALIGASLAWTTDQGGVRVDAVAGAALARRMSFVGSHLLIGGHSDAAGTWRLSGDPMFDRATGRFLGLRGIARRSVPHVAAKTDADRNDADSLRQLVHELRTPTNAISGFAELIEAQLLGPVSASYRGYATAIREQAGGLIAAIDDLDTAARIEGRALESRPALLPLQPVLDAGARSLAAAAADRGASIGVSDLAGMNAWIDDRLAERLVSRLLAALIAAASQGETIVIKRGEGSVVALSFTLPHALTGRDGAALLHIEPNASDSGEHGPLLGIGFTFRLVRNLAHEMGGALDFAPDRLTLRLPAAVIDGVGRAAN